jgi:hypothetical protein
MSVQTGLRRVGHCLVAVGTLAVAYAALKLDIFWGMEGEFAADRRMHALIALAFGIGAYAVAWIVYGFAKTCRKD